jgi:hypothetical protein
VPGVEQRIDALYGLPLDAFTAARNALAADLKKEGDAEAAERVRTLAKPPVAVWAINQAARTDKVSVRRLVKAADALRAAQEKALAGKHADLGEAQRREREAVRVLARTASAALGRETQVDRIERTLRAAALDPAARELLQSGRLTEELEPAGFDALAGIDLPPAPKQTPPKPKRDEAKERKRRELRASAQEAERRARALEREAAQARREADEAAAALAEIDE